MRDFPKLQNSVIPAKAGIQSVVHQQNGMDWFPAYAGKTVVRFLRIIE